jgi:cell wall-associated NlpC family hydrolase
MLMQMAQTAHASPDNGSTNPTQNTNTSYVQGGQISTTLESFTNLVSTPSFSPDDALDSAINGSLNNTNMSTQKLDALKKIGGKISERANGLVNNAFSLIGVPYKLGGTSISTGFDCSGFVRAVYKNTLGFVLPRTASEQAHATETIEKNELKPGDLVFFNTMQRAFSHVGVYIGDGKFIHAPRTGSHVRVENMRLPYWNLRFNGARRVSASGNFKGNGSNTDGNN